MISQYCYPSALGILTLVEENRALVELRLGADRSENPVAAQTLTPTLTLVVNWLDRYFAGERPEIGQLPLNPQGSQFRQQVWDILRRIPYGKTTTYAAIAAEIAQTRGIVRMSAQAVGGAVGHNPIPIIIPCHRVVGSGGQLVGYGGGLDRKKWLLDWERK